MTRQQFLADARGERHNNRVRAVGIGTIRLDNNHRTRARLFSASRRREIGFPHFTSLYCHWISPRAKRSS
jgi:hypothetical protein